MIFDLLFLRWLFELGLCLICCADIYTYVCVVAGQWRQLVQIVSGEMVKLHNKQFSSIFLTSKQINYLPNPFHLTLNFKTDAWTTPMLSTSTSTSTFRGDPYPFQRSLLAVWFVAAYCTRPVLSIHIAWRLPFPCRSGDQFLSCGAQVDALCCGISHHTNYWY